jgi:hypothetical protein
MHSLDYDRGLIMKKKEIANQVAQDAMSYYSEAGKGDTPRPTDQQKYEDGYERIFGKKKLRLRDMTEEDFRKVPGLE